MASCLYKTASTFVSTYAREYHRHLHTQNPANKQIQKSTLHAIHFSLSSESKGAEFSKQRWPWREFLSVQREREREFWKFRETWWDQLGLSSFSLDPPLSNLASAMAVGVRFFLTFMLAKYSLSLSLWFLIQCCFFKAMWIICWVLWIWLINHFDCGIQTSFCMLKRTHFGGSWLWLLWVYLFCVC